VDDVPQLLPNRQDATWSEWSEKQALGLRAYEDERETPEHVAAVAREFADFADLGGLVLDVGCGVSARPPYLRADRAARYIGIDPLPGHGRREFEFVVGVAERLPFRSGTFDVAVAATTLDHVVDPVVALREMKRVTETLGRIAIWVGVVDADSVRRAATSSFAAPSLVRARARVVERDLRGISSAAVRHLVVNPARRAATELRLRFRDRALIDSLYADRSRYHFHFFKEHDVSELMRQAGLRVVDTRILRDDVHGTSMFAGAVPEA